jgi:hypothetical protein
MNELDELVAQFGDDAAAMRQILDRNAAGRASLEGRETVYKAFVGGDETAMTQLARDNAAAAATAAAATTRSAAFDLDAMNAALDARMTSRFSAFTESPEFNTAVEKRATTIAESRFKQSEGDLIGRAAKLSDEIYTIRSSHAREFGKELDTPAFEVFLTANAGKFNGLPAAHDAYVQEERITARIDRGVREKMAASQTTEVPGTSLPTSQSPLGAMIRANPANAATTARGDGIDNAVKAFRQLQSDRGAN